MIIIASLILIIFILIVMLLLIWPLHKTTNYMDISLLVWFAYLCGGFLSCISVFWNSKLRKLVKKYISLKMMGIVGISSKLFKTVGLFKKNLNPFFQHKNAVFWLTKQKYLSE